MSITTNDLAVIRWDLLADWNKANSLAEVVPSGAVAQSLPPSPAPRLGLSIALGVDPKIDSGWLELRMPPTNSANSEIEEDVYALVQQAKKAGADDVRVRVLPRPTVSVIKPIGRAQNEGLAQAGGWDMRLLAKFSGSYRPPHIGCSIGHEEGPSGTLAAFVRVGGQSQVGALSCCHVLALCGDADPGDNIYQPGRSDKDRLLACDRLGKLSDRFAPFSKNVIANIDAAVATLAWGIGWANRLPDLPDIPPEYRNKPLGSVLPIAELRPFTNVGRVSRTTGFATGVVEPTSVDGQEVTFELPGRRAGTYKFSSVIEIKWDPHTKPGDSGALIFRLSDLRPVALHFAAIDEPNYPKISFGQPLEPILRLYNLELA